MVPTPHDVLSWIAAASPWFPTRHAQDSGITRESLEDAVTKLWQAQLIEASHWEKGIGQGFGLTAEGEKAAKDAALLDRILAGQTIEAELQDRPVPTTYDRGERARAAYYVSERPLVTQSLMLVNIAVFLFGLSIAWKNGGGRMAYANGQDISTLIKLGAVSGDTLVRGEWWRLGSANFVHVGLVHLMLNVYCLGMVGALAEDLWGRWRFLLIYLVAGLSGSSLAMMLKPVSLVAGASGATWGVMASLGVWLFLYRQHFKASIVDDFARRLMLAVLINGAISFWPRVSWEGHMGGAIGGVVMAFSLDLIRHGHRRWTVAGILGAIAFPGLMVAALLLVVAKSEAWRPLIAHEAWRQQSLYLESLQPELNEISPNAANTLLASLFKARGLMMLARIPKHKEEAKQLRTKAEQMRERIASHAPPTRRIPEMPGKATAYCDALLAFTQRLIEFLSAARDDFDAVKEAKRELDSHWQSLFQNDLLK